MKPELNDVRRLKMAEMYEAAFEQFVVEVAARVVGDEAIRAKLLQLVDPADRHRERIIAQLDRLNARLGPEDRQGALHAALLDVCEVERAARDFHQRQAEEVHDREVAVLFRELAREEERHLRIASEALQMAERRGARGQLAESAAEALRLVGENNALPLREGVSDFGAHHGKPKEDAA